jgi:hypothetical protein
MRENITPKFRRGFESVCSLPDHVLERMRPTRMPDYFKAQAAKLGSVLPYECMLDLERPVCLLSDGSLGVVWEIDLLPHETLSQAELERRLTSLGEIVEKVRSEKAAFQFIFDSEPHLELPRPEYLNGAEPTAPQVFLSKRIAEIESYAKAPKHQLRLMRRRAFVTLRFTDTRSFANRLPIPSGENEISAIELPIQALSRELMQAVHEVEYSFAHAGMTAHFLDGVGLLRFLRNTLHSVDERKCSATIGSADFNFENRISDQVMRGFAEMTPSGIRVGADVWEVASWVDQPPTACTGLWARLLEIDVPLRVVVNVRPCTDASDLDSKSFFLKNAQDAFGELQRTEVKTTQERMVRGEVLSWVSVHVLVRNEESSQVMSEPGGAARRVVSRLKTLTQIPFVVEKYAAPAIFLMSLPLGFSAGAAPFSGRERRVLSRNLAPYLPVFGGFRGTRNPMQWMISRGGEIAWLNPFDSETSAHMAVLASSGGGKSFYAQNLMMSFFAANGGIKKGHPLLFIIDKKTSYEIFARVVGEDFGCQIIKPPERFPNIFRGALDDLRLPVIVGVLKTAVSLVSENARVGAIEEMLLSQAVRAAFEQNQLDARTEYAEGSLREKSSSHVKIPRLSDVIENIFPIAAQSGIDSSLAQNFAALFAPFVGQGPYAELFDRAEFEEQDAATPGVSLFDNDAVSSHPVLSTLTTQLILCEILRQLRRPENHGRAGMLVIEEAGVLAGQSPEIVAFIRDAWKTFRKLGIACVGLTNEVDDFAGKPGPREMWNVSPNKVILRMLEKDLQKAQCGNVESGYPPLADDPLLIQLIGSLRKKDGAYSQGLWWSDEAKGTFVFAPTGFDYWCAASKPIEVETVYEVEKRTGSFLSAVSWLAQHFSNGVLGTDGRPRSLLPDELPTRREK